MGRFLVLNFLHSLLELPAEYVLIIFFLFELVFQSVIAVLVYGILFFPFFACLTTEYKLLGSLMGFLYVTMR